MDVQALGPAPLAPSPSRSVAPSAAPVPGREDVDLGTSVPAQPLEEGLGPDADGLVAARAGPRPASLAALFGDDKEPQPLWLEKEAFTEKEFDCEAYIANVRRFVPLETVRTELKRHVAALKSELVELINRDYNDFVNLSTKLVDVDGAVLRMRVPLSDLRAHLLSVREGVAAAPAALEDGLRRRAEAANARQTLELLLDTSNVLSKVEKLLVELQALPTADAAAHPQAGTASQPLPAERMSEGSVANGTAHDSASSGPGAGRDQEGQDRSHVNGLAANGEPRQEQEEGAGAAGPSLSNGLPQEKRRGHQRSAEELEEGRSRLLERIGSEMNRLKFYVAKGRDLPFVQSVEKRIAAAEATMGGHLSASLEKGLRARQRRVVYHCLRAYTALDSMGAAEDVFRRVVVSACVQRALEHQQHGGQAAAEGPGASTGGGLVVGGRSGPSGSSIGAGTAATAGAAAQDLLEDIYRRVKEEVAADCTFISAVVSAADSGLQGFQFLAGGVLREVHQRLLEARRGAFSPGRPAQFLLNHRCSLAFLDFLEGFCSSEAMLLGFRAHPSYEEFVRSWNLPAYYAARFRAIAGMLDEALAPPSQQQALVHGVVRRRAAGQQAPGEGEGSPPPPLALNSSVVLWGCLLRCWDPEVLIPSIADKFLCLTLQLLSRFGGWVKAGVAARQAGNATEHAGGEWALAATTEDFLAVWHDLELLAVTVPAAVVEQLPGALGPVVVEDPQLQSAVEGHVRGAAQQLQALGSGLAHVVSDVIGDRCIEVLRPVRAIAAMYRVPSRPPPTRHSHYVPGILQPLKAALTEGSGEAQALLSAEMRSEVVRLVLDKTTGRFHELARELVATAKRTESSLRLLQQRAMRRPAGDAAGGGGAGAPTFTDTDKIILQLFLDVQEFGKHVRALGVEPASMESFVALWQCVAPADRQTVDI